MPPAQRHWTTWRGGQDFTDRDCERVAELLNSQNNLSVRYDRQRVKQNRYDYVAVKNARGQVQGCAAVERLTTEVAEVGHLSVEPESQGQGYGRRLLETAEQRAQDMGCSVAQATTGQTNQAARGMLQAAGYTRTTTFQNPRTGNAVEVWQKPLGENRPADVSPPPAADAPAADSAGWWDAQMQRLLSQGYSEDEARRMLIGLLRRMGRPIPAGANG